MPSVRTRKNGSTHYSLGLSPAILDQWATSAAKSILTYIGSIGSSHVVLCYAGMSGTSHAVALSLALNRLYGTSITIGMVYVRKQYEKSYGRPVEFSNVKEDATFIFVDDFIDTGSTFNTVSTGLSKRFPNAKIRAMSLFKHQRSTGEETFQLAEKHNLILIAMPAVPLND